MGDKPDTGGQPAKKVVILGGGLSGLSAARRLLSHGYDITLVEKRPFLGGRACSFRDREADVEVDNGQHVFLGCNAYYKDFLRAIGAMDRVYLQKGLRAEVIRNGTRGVLSSTPFLGRLHLLPSFLRYPHLGFKDKLLAAYGMLRVMLTNRARHAAQLEAETGYEWLKRHHQTERAIDNLWNVIVLPALNDDVRDSNADMTLMVFQETLLRKASDAAIGFSKVGLTSLAGEPAQRYIAEKGGEPVLGKAVGSIEARDGLVTGVRLSDGSVLKADAYVSALPFDVLLDVLPDDVARGEFFSRAAGLGSSPIVGIHLWYDRQVMDQVFAAFLDTPVQWVFNKSLIQGSDGADGQYVYISLSGAWQHVDKPKEELREIFAKEMARLFPRARDAEIGRFLVVKERKATFRSVPGAAKHRLPQATPIPNLFLAGDWTKTGWPSTMESAIRSGVLAADAVAARV